MRAVKDDSAVPLCGGRSEKGGEAEGRAFRVRRNAINSGATLSSNCWLCALTGRTDRTAPSTFVARGWQLALRRCLHAQPFRPPEKREGGSGWLMALMAFSHASNFKVASPHTYYLLGARVMKNQEMLDASSVTHDLVTVAFDMCSSSKIIEDLSRTQGLVQYDRLMKNLHLWLWSNAKAFNFILYK